MNKELKPCPFCGGNSEAFHHLTISRDYWYVECYTEYNDNECCESRTCEFDTYENAKEAWNTRI